MRRLSDYTMHSRQQQFALAWPRAGKSLVPMAMLCLFWLLGGNTARAVSFSATLDRDTITLGESASLQVKFEGASPNDVPRLPSLADLQISYVGPSSQFSFVNGQTTSSVTHNFQITPQRTGDFTIPALTAEVSGQKLVTQPLRLRVLKPGAPPANSVSSGTQLAFMRLVVPKREVFLGEPLTVELQIAFREGIQNFGNFQLTSMPTEGFTASKNVQGQQRRMQIGNTVYTIVPLYFALLPIKTGPLTIGPITASVVVELPSNNRRRDPFLDQFGFRSFFGGIEQKQLTLAAEAVPVQSLPLPTKNVPPNFNGAVGSYTLAVNAGPTNVATGDPITVRVQISGRGSLSALSLPDQPEWRNFKTYPPTANVETSDQLGLQGTKTFEQVVTPESTEIHELPAFSFSFFDPEAKAYRTLTAQPVALTVRPGGATIVPTIAASKNTMPESPPAQDIVPIKQRPGTIAQISPPWVQQPWFLAFQSAPVLAFFVAFGWRKRADSLANNPRLRRQRHVAKVVEAGLSDLRRCAAENKSEDFFATLFRLLQEQLGERLDCPASAITEAVIEERLRSRGIPDTTLTALHELFQVCNLARYAPMQSSQELAAMVPKLENALNNIRRMKS